MVLVSCSISISSPLSDTPWARPGEFLRLQAVIGVNCVNLTQMKNASGCDMLVLTNTACALAQILIAGMPGTIPRARQLIDNCVLEIRSQRKMQMHRRTSHAETGAPDSAAAAYLNFVRKKY